jgi:uncharacterized membrane protein HdeD (DUF308 family)
MPAKNNDETIEAEIIEEKSMTRKNRDNRGDHGFFWGVILIILGILFFVQKYYNIDVWTNFWPAVLIIIGLFLIYRSFKK